MKFAGLVIPPTSAYPVAAIEAGISACGYGTRVHSFDPSTVDVLITWSPWNGSRRQAYQEVCDARGVPVIVVENGWLDPMPMNCPMAGQRMYQVAVGGWNGTGLFLRGGGPQRWDGWQVPIHPWKADASGGYRLVIGQRGGPDDLRTAPPDWEDVSHWSGCARVRPKTAPERSLDADLSGASECHVWTSNAATRALLAGIPVIQHGPNLMTSELASKPGEDRVYGDRLAVFRKLAWGQWTVAELGTPEPWKRALARWSLAP